MPWWSAQSLRQLAALYPSCSGSKAQHGLGFFRPSLPQSCLVPYIAATRTHLPATVLLTPISMCPVAPPFATASQQQVWKYLLTKKIQKTGLVVYTYKPSTEEERWP